MITNQDEKYEFILNWLRLYSIEPNLDKLKRQVASLSRWQANGCVGAVQAVTGFGKTWIALFGIYLMKRNNPDLSVIVVVPTRRLFTQWTAEVSRFGFTNVSIRVVNSYTKQEYWDSHWECDFMIADEGHRYCNKESKYFSKALEITKRRALIVLSATLDQAEIKFLENLNIRVVDTITMIEAKRMGYVSDYITYNYGIELNSQEAEVYDRVNSLHSAMLGKFQLYPDREMNWALGKACGIANDKMMKVGSTWRNGREWREWYASEMGWDGNKEHSWSPQNIGKYAAQWQLAIRRRKMMLYNHSTKIEVAKAIVDKLRIPTIVFSESTKFCNTLGETIGSDARVYHSQLESKMIDIECSKDYINQNSAQAFRDKVNGIMVPKEDGGYQVIYKTQISISANKQKEQALAMFENCDINTLITAKALDEGHNVERIECAIICSATSKQRQQIQREGRAIRFVADKKALIINLYIKGTQDENWLNKRQKGVTGLRWITNIDQIIL